MQGESPHHNMGARPLTLLLPVCCRLSKASEELLADDNVSSDDFHDARSEGGEEGEGAQADMEPESNPKKKSKKKKKKSKAKAGAWIVTPSCQL